MGGKKGGSSQQLDAACDGLSVAHIASDETRDDPERPGPQRTWELHPQKTDSSTTKNRNLSNKSGISTNKSGSITNTNRALTNKKENSTTKHTKTSAFRTLYVTKDGMPYNSTTIYIWGVYQQNGMYQKIQGCSNVTKDIGF
jgi:hypothetical protein